MTYNIALTNGSQLVTIANGSVDVDHSSLSLVGKNFTGYGKMMNENFVHLLENFSNTIEPLNPIIGQLWYDLGQKLLKVRTPYNAWKTIGSAHAGESPPQNPVIGDQWWDINELKLKGWTGTNWLIIGPIEASGNVDNGTGGQIGYTGSKGNPGDIGPSGPKGDPGEPGSGGDRGPRGPIGYTGSIGASGPIATIIPEDIVVNGVHFGKGLNSRTHNTRAGTDALKSVTSGDHNTAVGFQALTNNTTGNLNIAVGSGALDANTIGNNNIAIGDKSLKNNIGAFNVAIGSEALTTATATSQSVAVGAFAMRQNTGKWNTAIGTSTLQGGSGQYNTAVGFSAGNNTNVGNDNVYVGANSGLALKSGSRNTLLGPDSGQNIVSGSNNVVIGSNNGETIKNSNNNIILSDGEGNIRAQCDNNGNWVFSSISANNTTELLKIIYPVGCIYTSTSSQNPSTTFGFGSWAAFGEGRVLIGAGAGFTAGQTGGSADAVAVSHTHTVTDPGHTHTFTQAVTRGGQGGGNIAWQDYLSSATGRSTTGISIAAAGESGVGKNLQPYIVVYMWQRMPDGYTGPPTFGIAPSTTSVNEGSTVTYTVTTTNFGNGTLYWTNSGTTNASDFTDIQNSGLVAISNNVGTFTRTLAADSNTDGTKTIIIQLRTESTSGTIVVTATTVSVIDTSQTPAIEFTYTQSNDINNADFRALAVSAGWDQLGKLNIVIANGVTVGSANTTTPAATIAGNFPAGVLLTNNGTIAGAGGAGGVGQLNSGTAGTDGGTALLISSPCTLVNNGIIGGGGGGGGGGSEGSNTIGGGGSGGGGGGAGRMPGAGGSGVWPGATGTLYAGGSGGGYSGNAPGGIGGSLGYPGYAGIGYYATAGSRGAAGKSIVGITNVTVTKIGDVRGPTA